MNELPEVGKFYRLKSDVTVTFQPWAGISQPTLELKLGVLVVYLGVVVTRVQQNAGNTNNYKLLTETGEIVYLTPRFFWKQLAQLAQKSVNPERERKWLRQRPRLSR